MREVILAITHLAFYRPDEIIANASPTQQYKESNPGTFWMNNGKEG